MKIVMVGQGAFGRKHLDGLKNIKDAEVVSLVGGSKESTETVAKQYGIPHWTTNLSEALAQPGVDAAILTSPTQVHAAQAVECMKAGKHVEIEIPIADSLADARKIHDTQKATKKIAMAGHTRRFAARGRCANLPVDHTRTNRRGGSRPRVDSRRSIPIPPHTRRATT